MKRGIAGAIVVALTMAAATAVAPTAALAQASATPGKVDQVGGTTNFINMATLSSRFEVQAGELALQRSGNQAVRGFAEMMIKDHRQHLDTLKFTNASNASAPMPETLDSDYMMLMSRLGSVPASEFDREYMRMQIEGHEEVLGIYRGYSQVGEVESLRKLAAATIPVIERHLNEAKRIAGAL